MAPTYLSLFSGIGGLDLGLDRAGYTCVGQVEKDEWCRQVLAKHWPGVPRHDDVRTTVPWWFSTSRPRVDVVAGGYPCQPESNAGLRLGQEDPRWLWPAMAEVIDAVRPTAVIGENVLGHRTRGLRTVLDDLARLGYQARAGVVRACEVGAPHPRARLFVLAHAAGLDGPLWLGPGGAHGPVPAGDRGAGAWADPRHGPVAAGSGVRGVADGVPSGLDGRRVQALGNAVVPPGRRARRTADAAPVRGGGGVIMDNAIGGGSATARRHHASDTEQAYRHQLELAAARYLIGQRDAATLLALGLVDAAAELGVTVLARCKRCREPIDPTLRVCSPVGGRWCRPKAVTV